jgi:hypothetical protein
MKIILRTHGGLGNQLFQVLYGRLLAAKNDTNLVFIHDLNYQHSFELCNDFNMNDSDINWFERFVSASRIPKLMNRYSPEKKESFTFLNLTFLDGYFQDVCFYKMFSSFDINKQLENLKKELNIAEEVKDEVLVHFRLGDFFNDQAKVLEHVQSRLCKLDAGSTIITNQEEVFQLPEIQKILVEKSCKFHSTLNFDAIDVLKLMSSYKKIEANDSTMVFWAAVLGGARVDFSHPQLAKLLSFFKANNQFK